MKKGKLIVLEGVSGTGKETQAKLLQEFLAKRQIDSVIVYHPSAELKEIISSWRRNRKIDHVSEAYFLLADRYNRVQQLIKPALARGVWVISLRSWVSALVYQAQNTAERRYLTREFGRFEPKPSYLFWFDIVPAAALARIKRRHEETGEALGKFETPEFLGSKRQKYQQVLKNIPHIKVDAALPLTQVQDFLRQNLGFTKKAS